MIDKNSNQKGTVTFNDLPTMVTRILDEVSETRQMVSDLLKKEKPQREDRHKPMTVSEAAKYLTIPLPTLYDKLIKGEIPATKPGKRYVLYRDELDKWLESHRKNNVPLTAEEQNEAILNSNRRKPDNRKWG